MLKLHFNLSIYDIGHHRTLINESLTLLCFFITVSSIPLHGTVCTESSRLGDERELEACPTCFPLKLTQSHPPPFISIFLKEFIEFSSGSDGHSYFPVYGSHKRFKEDAEVSSTKFIIIFLTSGITFSIFLGHLVPGLLAQCLSHHHGVPAVGGLRCRQRGGTLLSGFQPQAQARRRGGR